MDMGRRGKDSRGSVSTYLVGHGHAALPCIKDGELMRLSVSIHDNLEEAFILFTAAIGRSD